MINCQMCGRKTEKKMRLSKCVKCHAKLCGKCGVYCRTCLIIQDEKVIISDYFRDKYATRELSVELRS